MDDDSSNRRLLLAAAMCLLVLALWRVLFPAPEQPGPKPGEGPVATSTAGQGGPTAEAPPSETHTGTAAAPTSTKRAVEPELFAFEGVVTYAEEEVPYEVTLTNVGGGIERFILPTYKARNEDNEATDEPIELANPTAHIEDDERASYAQMGGIRFLEGTTFAVPARMTFEVAEKGADRVLYRYVTDEGIEIEREYRLDRESFEIEMAVTVRNGSNRPQRHRMQIHSAMKVTAAMRQGGGFLSGLLPPPDHLQALCHTDGEVEREDYRSLEDAEYEFEESVQWVAMDRQYFVAALISRDREDARCTLRSRGEVAQSAMAAPEVSLQPGEEKRHKYTAYLGVKKQSILTRVDADLEGAVDYTVIGLNLAPLCTALLWILGVFHAWFNNWGLAILGLTFLVKLALFPLNQKSGKSMRAMSALKPEMEALKEKYPEDRQRQSEEMMRLYREHNVNPAGGCLPILIQMPIWFALYRSLWVSVDLYQQGFLWIDDLTTRDPYWILPITLMLVMFIQQKMTPTTMDPAQQKIMQYTMPLLFGGMMSALPAGLCFYILVNTLLTIVQQHFINKSIGPVGGSAAAQEAKT